MSNTIFELEHVSKIFGSKEAAVRAMDDVSLRIERGEIFGIIGMSGAGKSTLVRTLNRLEEVDEGRVLFEGRDLKEMSPGELRITRQSIGMIFQSFNLLSQKTVLENVMLPLKIAGTEKKKRKDTALQMLELVGLGDKQKAYPSQLSGGQKQRVAIARALSTNPEVLLCDEATSALDPKMTQEILDLLKKINQELKITIVIITHEMTVIEKICSKVAIIDSGKLAEVGEVQQIFTRPQTDVAKALVYPAKPQVNAFDMTDRRCLRVVFDGRAAGEPLIANLVCETGEKVNILSANTKSVGGIGFGQMILELPSQEEGAKKVIAYMEKHGVMISEVIKEGGETIWTAPQSI